MSELCNICGTNCWTFQNGSEYCGSTTYSEDCGIGKMESDGYSLIHREGFNYYFLKRTFTKSSAEPIIEIAVIRSYNNMDRELRFDLRHIDKFSMEEKAFSKLRSINLTDI